MRILVLGGTSFVGRAIVADALGQGDEVTLFSRGRTGAELFPSAKRLTGDRERGDYSALHGGAWDAVVDVSGYIPRHIAQAVDALGDRTGRYLFISTVSVFDIDQATKGSFDQDAARLAPERDTEDVTGATYGPLKVACEDDVLAHFGAAATIVRPGIVAGPHDPTDRFTYWVRRGARGGRVAVPGRVDQPVQVVDSRDLARLVTTLLAADQGGHVDAVGPRDAITMQGLIEACARAAGTDVEIVPIDSAAADLSLPLLLPSATADPLFQRSTSGAAAAGMPATSVEQTALDVAAWDIERGSPALTVDLSPEREQELIAAAGG